MPSLFDLIGKPNLKVSGVSKSSPLVNRLIKVLDSNKSFQEKALNAYYPFDPKLRDVTYGIITKNLSDVDTNKDFGFDDILQIQDEKFGIGSKKYTRNSDNLLNYVSGGNGNCSVVHAIFLYAASELSKDVFNKTDINVIGTEFCPDGTGHVRLRYDGKLVDLVKDKKPNEAQMFLIDCDITPDDFLLGRAFYNVKSEYGSNSTEFNDFSHFTQSKLKSNDVYLKFLK